MIVLYFRELFAKSVQWYKFNGLPKDVTQKLTHGELKNEFYDFKMRSHKESTLNFASNMFWNFLLPHPNLWCLINIPPYQFLEIPPGPYFDPRLSIFANYNFSTCNIFKYILSIKGISATFWVREVYFGRKINEISITVDSAKSYLTFKYGLIYPPPLIY